MEGALTIVVLTLPRNNDNNNSFPLHPNGNTESAKFAKITNFLGAKLSLISLHALPEQEGDNTCDKWKVTSHLSPRYVHDILLLDSRPFTQVPRFRRVAFAGTWLTKFVGILAFRHFSMASKVLTPHAFYYWMRGYLV